MPFFKITKLLVKAQSLPLVTIDHDVDCSILNVNLTFSSLARLNCNSRNDEVLTGPVKTKQFCHLRLVQCVKHCPFYRAASEIKSYQAVNIIEDKI